MKTRIIKRTLPNSKVEYTIQQKHFLFFWWWVDAWVNSISGTSCIDTFSTFEKANKNLRYFDGTKTIEEVVR